MQRTNTDNPTYYHRVVDCQWACPAHTNVPGYIRLIAQDRFTDAYMLNRVSNVFPGILGRTCDRPCEPACRRGRVEDKPVAICRLKRVAADHRGEVKHLLPTAPTQKNGKKVACIGAGPASLTVANDLMPLGYQVTIFEKLAQPGGLMRINIPSFRLPADVLDDEIGYIVDMGVEMRYNSTIDSMKALLDSGEFDAVFVGSGAPKGKELKIPGRFDTDQVFIGIEWLQNIHFGHVTSVGERVLIIGVGNTAMDCCRSAEASRRNRREGDRTQDAQVLQGVAVGARGCRGRRGSTSSRTCSRSASSSRTASSQVWSSISSCSEERNGELHQEVIGPDDHPVRHA
ncbi:MAG: FAD-dependent oxidoreductase [Vicinamibacterales bacterium]